MRRLIGWLKDAWLMLGVTLLLLLLVDQLLRNVVATSGAFLSIAPGAKMPSKSEAEFFSDSPWAATFFSEFRAARHTRWTPYTYWRRQAFAGETINIDAVGVRRSWSPLGKPEHAARITQEPPLVLVFGGSTIWGSGARDEFTIPSYLARQLAQENVAVQVVNRGESGYVSTQELIQLVRLLQQGIRPHTVIFYDGANDVFAALQSGEAGLPQNESERIADYRATNGLDNWLAAFPSTLEGIQTLTAKPAKPMPVADLAQDIIKAYTANVESVRALGEQFGFSSLFFWQPTVFVKTTRSEHEERVYLASIAYHRDLQLASDALIADYDGTFNLSGIFEQESSARFMDFCHVSESANKLIAQAILPHLRASLEEKRPDIQLRQLP